MNFATHGDLHAATDAAVEEQAGHDRIRQQGQSRMVEDRDDIRFPTAAAHAVTDVEVLRTDAHRVCDIDVFEIGHAVRPARIDERGGDGMQLPCALDPYRSAGAAACTGAAFPILALAEERQHRV